jgi:RNA polymerase sigma factor (sigma-70 family)
VSGKAAQIEEDRILVAGVLERRDGAFETLVGRHQRLVWHMIHGVVRHPEDTRDVCQEAFLRVHRELHRFRFESLLSTWIARIAWHAALRHLERKRLPVVSLDDDEGALAKQVTDDFDLEASCANTQLLECLHAAIEALPPLKRAVITLHYLEDVAIGEIAIIVDRPEGTVKSELLRARGRLRKVLINQPGESS